jgi:hypothetical protein
MNLKNKFHLTLVVLITLANSLIGICQVDTANALTVTPAFAGYNLKVYNQNISNIYNNINIKYISIRLYNININNNINKEKVKLSSVLSLKEKIEILMYSIKQVESNGRYKAKSKWSSACGAYQYMTITWDNYQGFKTACLAPESVQDSRMRGEIKYLWTKYHDWEKVIASHFLPAYADNKALWNKHYYAGQPTIREYVQNVQTTMNTVVSQLATT